MPKIIHERERCIGCGSCISICPEHWEMGDDGKSSLKGADKKGDIYEKQVDDLACSEEAAEACPVTCIKVEK
ncbi:MAG: ferredoxin [Nanoarchaeota archaeon]|nr:ferredoxin [Nanoarchaeota archaeon]